MHVHSANYTPLFVPLPLDLTIHTNAVSEYYIVKFYSNHAKCSLCRRMRSGAQADYGLTSSEVSALAEARGSVQRVCLLHLEPSKYGKDSHGERLWGVRDLHSPDLWGDNDRYNQLSEV